MLPHCWRLSSNNSELCCFWIPYWQSAFSLTVQTYENAVKTKRIQRRDTALLLVCEDTGASGLVLQRLNLLFNSTLQRSQQTCWLALSRKLLRFKTSFRCDVKRASNNDRFISVSPYENVWTHVNGLVCINLITRRCFALWYLTCGAWPSRSHDVRVAPRSQATHDVCDPFIAVTPKQRNANYLFTACSPVNVTSRCRNSSKWLDATCRLVRKVNRRSSFGDLRICCLVLCVKTHAAPGRVSCLRESSIHVWSSWRGAQVPLLRHCWSLLLRFSMLYSSDLNFLCGRKNMKLPNFCLTKIYRHRRSARRVFDS